MVTVVEGHLSHPIQQAEDGEAHHRKASLQMVNTSEVEVGAIQAGAVEAVAEAAEADLLEDVEVQQK